MKTTEIIIKCNPDYKPFSLPILLNWIIHQSGKLQTVTYIHSDLKIDDKTREVLLDFLPKCESKSDLKLTLIWTSTVQDHLQMMLNKKTLIGEVNLVKYLTYKLDLVSKNHLDESNLDQIHCLLWKSDFDKSVKDLLQNDSFLAGKSFGISDLVLYSHLKQIPNKKLSKEFLSWMTKCDVFLSAPEKSQNGQNKTETSGDKRDELFTFFKENGIDFETIDHPEVFTVEAMMPYLNQLPSGSALTKNLFLKDKKGGLYLLSALHDKPVNMNDISKRIKAPGLRFASEDILYESLKVKQGCVTAYALLNDLDSKVKFLLDQDVLQAQKVYFHPLANNATTGISIEDFQKFVQLTNHTILSLSL